MRPPRFSPRFSYCISRKVRGVSGFVTLLSFMSSDGVDYCSFLTAAACIRDKPAQKKTLQGFTAGDVKTNERRKPALKAGSGIKA
jgi:hypothetical protein